jgi:hypothetical protein
MKKLYGLLLSLLLLLFHFARGLGAAQGAEDVDLFFVADEAFSEFLRPQEGHVPAGALGAFGVHQVSLFLGHIRSFSVSAVQDSPAVAVPSRRGRYEI